MIFGTLLVLSGPAIAEQQTSPNEVIEALNTKAAVLQQNLDQAFLGLAKQKSMMETMDKSAKWVLDNWVSKTPEGGVR